MCVALSRELSEQITAAGIDAEVVVMDDGSSDASTVEQNRAISNIEHCTFIRNESNAGRATVCNKLAAVAHGRWLVFLDADVFPTTTNFVSEYASATSQASIVGGGVRYRTDSTICPLRLMFGLHSEVSTAAERNKNPYKSFVTANVMMSAEVMQHVHFAEDIKQYGYEDLLMGKELQNRGYTVMHIDNPVFHDDKDTSEQFLQKTRTSLHTLRAISNKIGDKSRINNAYMQLKTWHLLWAMRIFFRATRKPFERNLLSQHPQILVFNLYKLGYYCELSHGSLV